VTQRPRKTAIDTAAEQLRALALSVPEGALLGAEDALVSKLGAARNTVRQVARLLEREGLLTVRRGINGGYFAARPSLHTIEQTVSAYLSAIAVAPQDVTLISSLLWVEAMRRAALLPAEQRLPIAASFAARLEALAPDAPFAAILDLEQDCRTAIFAATGSAYIELILQINYVFAQNSFPSAAAPDGTPAHGEFVANWRGAKRMELAALADGDEQLAMMAARHIRTIWHARIWNA
jgi:DNA-binding FadR family transcriptional regulator